MGVAEPCGRLGAGRQMGSLVLPRFSTRLSLGAAFCPLGCASPQPQSALCYFLGPCPEEAGIHARALSISAFLAMGAVINEYPLGP